VSALLPSVSAAVEGDLDEAILRRLARDIGLRVGTVYGKNGKDDLDRRLAGYDNAARFAPWIILRDLDHDAECPPELRGRLLPDPAPGLCFRIPVRSTEAWLLADPTNLARYLSIRPGRIPPHPEELPRPKRTLVDLARGSRRAAIVREMVPPPGISSEVGPAFAARLADFARGTWDPRRASRTASSLLRTLRALRTLRDTLDSG
jgi:hypothetical protein